MTNHIGKSLGRYHILEKLGEGGMATVYKAFDTRLEREVALKVILQEKQHSEKFLKRFAREARTLAQLTHTNIVKVLDSGEHGGTPFIVMEYIPGNTLKQKLGKPMPWHKAAQLLVPIARALACAHEHNIIHRDVKPANILLSESDEPMLSDFGVSKILEADEETVDLTGTGIGVGTPAYMAPEQGLGKSVDHRADIYALGIIFYELITGRRPYQADTPMAIMIKKVTDPLPRPKKIIPDLPTSVEQVLLKALAKAPDNRYQECSLFADALEKIANGEKFTFENSPNLSQQFRIKRWLPWIAGGGLLLVICTSGVVLAAKFWSNFQSPKPDDKVSIVDKTPTVIVQQLPVYTQVITPTPTLIPAMTDTPDEPWGKIVLTCQLFNDENRNQICIMNADGSEYRQLTSDNHVDHLYPSLAPNGQSIVYISKKTGNDEIFEMDLQGNASQLTSNIGELNGPEISPDGQMIVFANEVDYYISIWIMDRDGSNPRAIYSPSEADALDPTWSPDGGKVLFAMGYGNNKRLYTINDDGSKLQQIGGSFVTRGRSDWSPDGETIGSYSGESWKREIFLMDIAGQNLRQISSGGNTLAPSFSPDGQWVAFTGYIDQFGNSSGCEIYTMKTDGSQVIRLTDNDYCDWQPRWGP
jgi:serine/threonine protein kinase